MDASEDRKQNSEEAGEEREPALGRPTTKACHEHCGSARQTGEKLLFAEERSMLPGTACGRATPESACTPRRRPRSPGEEDGMARAAAQTAPFSSTACGQVWRPRAERESQVSSLCPHQATERESHEDRTGETLQKLTLSNEANRRRCSSQENTVDSSSSSFPSSSSSLSSSSSFSSSSASISASFSASCASFSPLSDPECRRKRRRVQNTIDALPDDLLCEMLLFLPFDEVGASIPLVSRRFCRLALLPYIWTFFYASAFSPAVSSPASSAKSSKAARSSPASLHSRVSSVSSPVPQSSGERLSLDSSSSPDFVRLSSSLHPSFSSRAGGRQSRRELAEAREREEAEAAAARAAAEEICFVEMEAAMRLGRDRAALLSLQRQTRVEPVRNAESLPREDRTDKEESLFSLPVPPPPRAVAALLTHCHVQRLQRLHALRDQQAFLKKQKDEGRLWGAVHAVQGERSQPHLQSVPWWSPSYRQMGGSAFAQSGGRRSVGEGAEARSLVKAVGGEALRDHRRNASASGFSLSDYLFFTDDGEPSELKEVDARKSPRVESSLSPASGEAAASSGDPRERGAEGRCGDEYPCVSSPRLPRDRTDPQRSRAANGDAGAAAGDARARERTDSGCGDKTVKAETPETRGEKKEEETRRPGENEGAGEPCGDAEMDEDQFVELLFGRETSSCSTSASPRHGQEGTVDHAALSESPPARMQSANRSSSPAAACGESTTTSADASLLAHPAQLAARRFAATPPASLSEALRLWKASWSDSAAFSAHTADGEAAEKSARASTAAGEAVRSDKGSTHADEPAVSVTSETFEKSRASASHVCHGRTCDIWSIPQFELYLCRDSGAFHCCGLRCDRMVPSDSDVGFLVCPVSGLMVDPALINAWTARELQSAPAALLDFGACGRSRESDALRLRSAELMNELVVATYVTEQQAGADDDDEMAGIGGMFGRFWTAGYMAEHEGEILRPKKRCKYT
ncbi:hypothetical protein TGME49_275780 [Toxoplasma gondii ME49]|uniref:F-box protein n=2 Tax=Toxoplasma gondii TaxID=5811 RepID=S8F7S1_TOXGM|nr:hypothetical protein TGME49_275780 [Toxoplasma gondii ME49]EPT31911.1 hypothetical protein TGME49_275780 [Toxoplasma gondii ME49]KYF38826.1 putative F-box protein [Toxoplasma gondii ARI]|eukprot:XP_002371605.2 hypothetical protein TGME49_275780 [Toxoplasma gondii ME49]